MSPVLTLPVLAMVLGCVLSAHAQNVQRIVGPDGRVTYTDRAAPAQPSTAAPATDTKPPAVAPTTPAFSPPAPSSTFNVGSLPFALRQAAQRYPVTLYTGDKCGTCVSTRELLVKRGVPFIEKTVTTQDDAQAFAGLGAENVLPLTTVGPQRISGFLADDLNRYLDAAGYPAESQLPRSFRYPLAQALAPVAPAAPASPPPAPQAERAATPSAPSVVAPPPPNPAGIRF